jgi:hypothetical protein
MNIIGIGSVGKAIAEKFKGKPNYTCFSIDNEVPCDFLLDVSKKPEYYEDILVGRELEFLENFEDDENLVILCGSELITSCSLVFIEKLKNDTSILYIRPDKTGMNTLKRNHERMVFNVLQEYTRSGRLKRFYLISNENLEKFVPNLTLRTWYDTLNETIASTFEYFMFFENTKPLIDNLQEIKEISRILTFGIVNFTNKTTNYFYDIKNIQEIQYHFGFSEEQLNNDETLMPELKSIIKIESNKIQSLGYTVHNLQQNQFVLTANFTHLIQQ